MKRRAFLRLGRVAAPGATLLLLTACGTLPRGRDRDAIVFDAADGRSIGEGDLAARMAAAPIVLLGERHDNPAHHRIRADLIGEWSRSAAGRPKAVVFEQLDREHDDALRAAQRDVVQDVVQDVARHRRGVSPADAVERLLDAARFDRRAWSWPLHRPVFEAAATADARWIAANFSRLSARRPVSEADPTLTAIVQSARWTEQAQRLLEAALREGHCNQLPERLIGRMVEIQRLRDAALAAPLYDANERRTLLIAGNGHVRRDHGVPLYLGRLERTALVVGFEEASTPRAVTSVAIRSGLDAALGPERAEAARAAYDVVVVTPAFERDDPCRAFAAPPPAPPPAPQPAPQSSSAEANSFALNASRSPTLSPTPMK